MFRRRPFSGLSTMSLQTDLRRVLPPVTFAFPPPHYPPTPQSLRFDVCDDRRPLGSPRPDCPAFRPRLRVGARFADQQQALGLRRRRALLPVETRGWRNASISEFRFTSSRSIGVSCRERWVSMGNPHWRSPPCAYLSLYHPSHTARQVPQRP